MRIAIFGAGAIGGYLAAKLAAVKDVELSLIARGPHLEAIRTHGLKLAEGGRETVVTVRAAANSAEIGPQDYVILALKAHSVAGSLDGILPLLGPETAVVTAQNGVPWWYFHRLAGPFEGTRVEAVDPAGRISAAIGPERAIGCVVYPATEVEQPGFIRHVEGDRFVLGEPSGERTERVARVAAALVAGGLRAPVRPDIRSEIWVKLWGNLAFNPVSALTGGTLAEIGSDPGTRAVVRAMMVEGEAIGTKLGARFGVTVDQRIEGARAVGAHRTSMLQDLDRGRPMEIDALVTAVQELGRIAGVPTPAIDLVLGLVVQRARLVGCYPAG